MIVNCSNPTCGAFTYVTPDWPSTAIEQLSDVGWDVHRGEFVDDEPLPYCPRCLA